MLIGVSWTVETRFCAVTTISSSDEPPVSVATPESAFTSIEKNSPRTPISAPRATTVLNLIESIHDGCIQVLQKYGCATPLEANVAVALC